MRLGFGMEVRRFADGARPLPTVEQARAMAALPTGDDSLASALASGSDWPWTVSYVGLRPTENPELMGKTKYFVFDDMRWSDPAVKSTLWLYKLPIKAGDYSCIAADANPVDKAVRDAVCWNFGLGGELGTMDLSWKEQQSQELLMLDFGAMFEEIVYGDPVSWWDADGDEHLLRPIARLAPRFPSSIRWPDGVRTDPRTGLISWLVQDVPGAMPIPGELIAPYVLDREGIDWMGTSLLRPMYGPWRLKRALMISSGIAWDRYSLGVPAVWYPKGGGTSKKREAEDVARNYRAHERAWLVFEGKRGDPNGWDIDIIDGQKTVADPTQLLRLYDEQIFTGAMQHFMVLGRTGGGNRALGEALGEPFYLAAQAIAEDLVMMKLRTSIRRFVDVNFGTDVDVPKIEVSGIQTHNLQELATSIYDLSQAGLSFTDPDTQNDIRQNYLDLRPLPAPLREAIDGFPEEVGIEQTPPPGMRPAITDGAPTQKEPPKGQPPVKSDQRPLTIAEMAQEGDALYRR